MSIIFRIFYLYWRVDTELVQYKKSIVTEIFAKPIKANKAYHNMYLSFE